MLRNGINGFRNGQRKSQSWFRFELADPRLRIDLLKGMNWSRSISGRRQRQRRRRCRHRRRRRRRHRHRRHRRQRQDKLRPNVQKPR